MTQKTPGPAHPYRLLARFYDDLQGDAAQMNRHARWNILRDVLPRPRSVCDLGCGSGETALHFARRGCRVYAVDLSPVFCRITRQKARTERLAVRVFCADMRDVRLPTPVELVTCEFATLNHLRRRTDLRRLVRSVWRALLPGGWFLFDVNTCASLKEQYASTHWFETPRFKLVLHGEWNAARKQAVLDLDWFVPEQRGLWRHRRERVNNICWSEQELREALRTAGFRRIRSCDGVDVRPFHPEARRGYDRYFLALKSLRRQRRQ